MEIQHLLFFFDALDQLSSFSDKVLHFVIVITKGEAAPLWYIPGIVSDVINWIHDFAHVLHCLFLDPFLLSLFQNGKLFLVFGVFERSSSVFSHLLFDHLM